MEGRRDAIADALGPFTPTYVERCRAARLLRRPGQVDAEARRLERGDCYAWRLGSPAASGGVRVAQVVEPRTVYIVTDRLWWTPRLDQLLHRVEVEMRRRSAVPGCSAREWIARQLADRVGHAASWEEAALDVLLGDGQESVSAANAPAGSRSPGPP
jgi:hypothetical protein